MPTDDARTGEQGEDGTAAVPPTKASTPIVLEAAVASAIGGRDENEDYAAFDHGLFAISDGIGGAPNGREASHTACTVAIDSFASGVHDIDAAFASANRAVITLKHWIGSPNAGATLMLATMIDDNVLDIVWVGDCTALLLHDGELSVVAKGDRAEGNALASAVGYDPDQAARHVDVPLAEGDRVLLCTDGVLFAGEYRGETYEQALERIEKGLSVGSDRPSWISEIVVRDALRASDEYADNTTALVLVARGERPAVEGERERTVTRAVTPVAPTARMR